MPVEDLSPHEFDFVHEVHEVSGGAVTLHTPFTRYPLLDCPHAFDGSQRVQAESDGFDALHTPLQSLVPAFVIPQTFAAEVQAEPYPAGFAGAIASQNTPWQSHLPVALEPQELLTVQVCPYFGYFNGLTAGIPALHVPPLRVPTAVSPQTFAADVQAIGQFTEFGFEAASVLLSGT